MAHLWNAENGDAITALKGHTEPISTASLSPDGKTILTASLDNTARLWNAATGAEIAVLKGHTKMIHDASFSPDGKCVVTGSSDKTARLWDTNTGTEIAVLLTNEEYGFGTVLFSPDGCVLLTVGQTGPAGRSNTGQLWCAKSGVIVAILQGHTNSIRDAAFSSDGKRLITGSEDNTARLWDAATGAEIAVLKGHAGAVGVALFSPDGNRALRGWNDNTARLWDGENGVEILCLKGHLGWINSASFSPDGRRIVTASSDNTARSWDAADFGEIVALRGNAETVWVTSFSPDGKRIVTGALDGTAKLWNAESGREINTVNDLARAIVAASFSLDGKRVIMCTADNTALWDTERGPELKMLRRHENVMAAAVSPDGKRVATGSSDGTGLLWDVINGAEIVALEGHYSTIGAVSFSSDGTRLVTSASDGARLWHGESGSQTAVLSSGSLGLAASFSPDGKCLVAAAWNNSPRLLDAATGVEIVTLRGHTAYVQSVSFSPDGRRVLTGSSDKTARIWDAATGAEIASLKIHPDGVTAASFSPDGNRVVTGSDNVGRIFDVSRTAIVNYPRAAVLTAALARGIGNRTMAEAGDLLMQEAPDDLFAAATRQLPSTMTADVKRVIALLGVPRHPNSYLPPTLFADKFGLERPGATTSNEAGSSATGGVEGAAEVTTIRGSDDTAASPTQLVPFVVSAVAADDLAGQVLAEMHAGIPIFGLADGRYHVISHFAVATLDEARAAAEALSAATRAA